MKDMRSRIFSWLVVVIAIVLAACGAPSKDNVTKKLSDKWNDSKGYELQATMEIKTGSEPRLYDVDVWHTKPDFYRVHVTQSGKDESQMIVRNEDGVFVVTPSLGKTYKFQSDWPAQNSQAYLIGALSEDITADKNATMTEEDDAFVFETETRNNHRKVLPTQKIYINKKTWLPIYVSILDENKEEQIRITFNKITLGTARDAKEYAVELNNEESKPAEDEADDEAAKEEGFETYYPTVNWQGVTLEIEESIKTENGTRSFMTFGGDKEFTIVQERVQRPDHKLPVSIEGDPVDLGFAVAAITEKSIRWESDGISFFIASETLTKDEMIDVALSMSADEMK
jgi:outer membrane lipoprotein-sorting protein